MENNIFNKLNTKDLRLAKVKYYDTKHNGAELSDLEAYAFLVKVGENQYVNVFDPTDGMAVFERSAYSNYTKDDVPYGNRLIHLCGDIVDGACYIIEKDASVTRFFEADVITLERLKEYMVSSNKFFVDRLNFLQRSRFHNPVAYRTKVRGDTRKLEELKRYIASHENAVQYKK